MNFNQDDYVTDSTIECRIEGGECVEVSGPGFFNIFTHHLQLTFVLKIMPVKIGYCQISKCIYKNRVNFATKYCP